MPAALRFALFAGAGFLLSACAVVDAGTTVVSTGAHVVGTAATVTADVVTAPFGSGEDEHKK